MVPLIFGNSQIGGSPCNVSAPKRLTTFWSVCGNGTLCACMPFHSSSLNNSKTGAKPKPKQHELKQHSPTQRGNGTRRKMLGLYGQGFLIRLLHSTQTLKAEHKPYISQASTAHVLQSVGPKELFSIFLRYRQTKIGQKAESSPIGSLRNTWPRRLSEVGVQGAWKHSRALRILGSAP